MEPLFQNSNIHVMKLTKWLNCASGIDTYLFVALPLIQRDAVWKPKQIIDLWDTVLRGMPLGSLLVNDLPKNGLVRRVGQTKAENLSDDIRNSLGLLDGQQRTLALLAGWQWGENLALECRIWVDFADISGDECLYRLRMTTKFQPFGFQKNEPSSKLLSHERYVARQRLIKKLELEDLDKAKIIEIKNKQDHELDLNDTRPYGSKLPLDLRKLIQQWLVITQTTLPRELKKSQWRDQVLNQCKEITHLTKEPDGLAKTFDSLDPVMKKQVEIRVEHFAESLEKFFAAEIALIKVDVAEEITDENEKNDPALAILFKRVGAGGTALSDEDYIYSVIKHHLPEAYNLISELHQERSIASLMSETNLVMTTIRIALAQSHAELTTKHTDKIKFTKKEFQRLIQKSVDQNSFLNEIFLPMIQAKDAERSTAAYVFDTLNDLLAYQKDQPRDLGFPEYALPLIGRPLVQVLLRWIHQNLERGVEIEILKQSRADLLRFVIFWILAVGDKDKASLMAFEILKSHTTPDFPVKELYRTFIENKLALSIVPPHVIESTLYLKEARQHPEKVLRSWSERFEHVEEDSEQQKNARNIYSKFWGNKRLLLWLQREAVSKLRGKPSSKLDDINTPYDYDHICPSADWVGQQTLTDFVQGSSRWVVGNSIGNIRILESSQNRSDGDAAPIKKLYIDQPEMNECLIASAIDLAAIDDLKQYSIEPKRPRHWNAERARVFQKFVENRTFQLYERLFNELGFENFLQAEESSLDTEMRKLNIA